MKSPFSPENAFLAGDDELAQLIRATDWSKTPLGAIELWPQSLRTSLSICLNSHFPMMVWWGKELRMFYNQAFRSIIGEKHPGAVGAPAREIWADNWPVLSPLLLQSVLEQGEPTWTDDQLLLLDRPGFSEECYFNFSHTPIWAESGLVGGVLTTASETSDLVISARQLQALKDLASALPTQPTAQKVYEKAAQVLGRLDRDIPFLLIYQIDPAKHRANLLSVAGLGPAADAAPASIDLIGLGEMRWPLWKVMQSGQAEVASDLVQRWGELPGGAWTKAPEQALLVPIIQGESLAPGAILIAGLNPHRNLDERYQTFLQMAGDRIALEINRVQAQAGAAPRANPIQPEPPKPHILVADDDDDMRYYLERTLRPLYRVTTVSNGLEALEATREHCPDLLLTDLTMPRMDGLGLVSAIRDDPDIQALPVIMLSARGEARAEGLAAGVNTYLIKPFIKADLLQAIRTNLELGRIRLQSESPAAGKAAFEADFALRTRELRESNVKLQRSNEDLKQFAYVASHDLQEPLRKIKIFSSRLVAVLKDQLDDPARGYLDKITDAAGRMDTLIQNLLQYSRLDQPENQFERIDLNETLKSVLADFDLRIQQQQAQIEKDPLPVIEGIPFQLNQLFFNLIGNSLRFVAEGRRPLVRISARQLQPSEVSDWGLHPQLVYHELIFSDNGIGFRQEYAEQIFVIFSRLNDKHVYGGTGIGLAICRKIVTLHHGEIFAKSQEGEGAAFHVILPERQPESKNL